MAPGSVALAAPSTRRWVTFKRCRPLRSFLCPQDLSQPRSPGDQGRPNLGLAAGSVVHRCHSGLDVIQNLRHCGARYCGREVHTLAPLRCECASDARALSGAHGRSALVRSRRARPHALVRQRRICTRGGHAPCARPLTLCGRSGAQARRPAPARPARTKQSRWPHSKAARRSLASAGSAGCPGACDRPLAPALVRCSPVSRRSGAPAACTLVQRER